LGLLLLIKKEEEIMRIVNKKRFVSFMLFVLVVFFLLTSIIVEAARNITLQIARVSEELTEAEIDFIEDNFEKVKVTVSKGDTSWTIQSSLTPNYDTRQVLYLTGKLNGKSMGNIKAGETLIFLKEREGN